MVQIGDKINELTVIEETDRKQGQKRFKCRCSCGNITIKYETKLKSGVSISCGCKKVEQLIENNKKKAAANLDELLGKTFNQLTIIEEAERINGKRQVKCLCSCGSIKSYDAYKVKSGDTKSCGCAKSQQLQETKTIHNGRHTRLYSKWSGMKRRCYNQNDSHYPDYGGRGITICDEWKDDFATFRKWAYLNGYDDSLTIERIDVNKGYSPSNCKWIPFSDQGANKSTTVRMIYKGEVRSVSEISKLENMNHKTITSRYYRFVKRNPEVDINSITFEMIDSNYKRHVQIIYKGVVRILSYVSKAENINHKTLSTRYYYFKKRNPHIDENSITFDMLIPR